MTRAASTIPFRVLLVAIAAAVLFLDLTLAHARATRQLPSKPAADCTTAPAVAPAPASPPPSSPQVSVPPGFAAAFGSCGDAGAASSPRQ